MTVTTEDNQNSLAGKSVRNTAMSWLKMLTRLTNLSSPHLNSIREFVPKSDVDSIRASRCHYHTDLIDKKTKTSIITIINNAKVTFAVTLLGPWGFALGWICQASSHYLTKSNILHYCLRTIKSLYSKITWSSLENEYGMGKAVWIYQITSTKLPKALNDLITKTLHVVTFLKLLPV